MKLINRLFARFRGPGLSNDEIADLLIRFVEDTVDDPWEFDDFISCSQQPEIEPYRDEIILIRENYPPDQPRHYCNNEGVLRIGEIAKEIRAL